MENILFIIQVPPRIGFTFFSYKKSFSIVLFAVCNTNYEFTLVDIGEAGLQSDGGIYNNSKSGRAIDKNFLNVSEPTKINEYGVAKKIFALKRFML